MAYSDVQQQPVKVKLSDVMQLVNEYHRTVRIHEDHKANNDPSAITWLSRRVALQFALDTLQLPYSGK